MKNKKGKPFEITVKHDINIFLYAIIKNIPVNSLEILSSVSLFRFIEDISSRTCAKISVTKKYAYYILTRGTGIIFLLKYKQLYVVLNTFSSSSLSVFRQMSFRILRETGIFRKNT